MICYMMTGVPLISQNLSLYSKSFIVVYFVRLNVLMSSKENKEINMYTYKGNIYMYINIYINI